MTSTTTSHIVLQHGLVQVRTGRKLYTRKLRIGKKKLETDVQLFFVHGTCATEQQFDLLLDNLQPTKYAVDCILYDWMGCGKSPHLKDYSAYSNEESRADLLAVFHLTIDTSKPVLLVGHSYGPMLFLPLLQTLPNLKGCVFLSSALRTPHLKNPDGGHMLFKLLPLWILNCLQSKLTEAFLQMAVHPSNTKIKQFSRLGSNQNNMIVARGYHGHHYWLRPNEICVQVPSLIVHGLHDGVIGIAAGQELANALHPTKFVTIEQASHLVMMEQPKLVADAMVEFMNEILALERPN
jgi:pimeloyl-ACP methyl ester carboxylesterase